jgi:hypothetical protein
MQRLTHAQKVCPLTLLHSELTISSNVDPVFWTVTALKKSGVLPAEVISGRRQVRPSKKAKAAAGIYSGEDEPESDLDDIGPIKIGTKRKSKGFKNTSSSLNKKQKGKEALVKKTHTHRKATNGNGDSLDGALANEDENCHEDPDEADAYEQLRVQRDKDRPVSQAMVNHRLPLTRHSSSCLNEGEALVAMMLAPLMSGQFLHQMSVRCQMVHLRKVIGARFAGMVVAHDCRCKNVSVNLPQASKGRKALADRWYIDSQETHRPVTCLLFVSHRLLLTSYKLETGIHMARLTRRNVKSKGSLCTLALSQWPKRTLTLASGLTAASLHL